MRGVRKRSVRVTGHGGTLTSQKLFRYSRPLSMFHGFRLRYSLSYRQGRRPGQGAEAGQDEQDRVCESFDQGPER
jgi:hypothetical protein